MKKLILAACLLCTPAVAHAETWDQTIKRLCTSTKQDACWVKAGAAICDKDQIACKDVPDHAPAKVLRKANKRWLVETPYGKGWVSERMMMVDSSK